MSNSGDLSKEITLSIYQIKELILQCDDLGDLYELLDECLANEKQKRAIIKHE